MKNEIPAIWRRKAESDKRKAMLAEKAAKLEEIVIALHRKRKRVF